MRPKKDDPMTSDKSFALPIAKLARLILRRDHIQAKVVTLAKPQLKLQVKVVMQPSQFFLLILS